MRKHVAKILFVGGIYNTILVIFHILFWKLEMFNWKEELPAMSAVNCEVIQMLNIAAIITISLMAYLNFFHAQELLDTRLGKVVLVWFSLFWLVRLVEQFIFSADSIAENVIIAFYILPGLLFYLVPLILSSKNIKP